MGADEKKNVKKPTVSSAVVRKKPSDRRTTETGKTTEKNRSTVRSSAGKSTAGSHTGRNTGNSSAGKSGSTKRNSTGKNGSTGGSRTGKKKKRKGITPNLFILILSVVVGIILVILISAIMQNKYLKTKQTESQYILGQPFYISGYVEAVNDKATVELASEGYQPEEVGTCDVKYIVRCGKLKRTKTVTIEVVDQESPVISGPDTLGLLQGEEVNLLGYYTVEDAEPDLDQKLSIDKEVDTSQTGSAEYTLYVTDWSNNSTSKTIKLVVCSYEGARKAAALAVRSFNQEKGYAVTQEGVYVYQPDNMENTYVLIEDELYKVKDEEVSKAEADEDLSASIKANGEWIKVSTVEYFNYYSET